MVAAGAAAEAGAGEAPRPEPDRWPLYQRILFRFAFCYFVLYSLPAGGRVSPLAMIPGAIYTVKLWHAIAPWVAIHVFHLTGWITTYFPTGSGDTTLGYIENLCFAVFAAAGAAIWSVADRKRGEYKRLHYWLRVLVRYTLAFTMFSYGFAKIFPLQFQPTNFAGLVEPYGNFSPMGVLWRFMGASLGYTIFAGASEATGGALLLMRRTTTLGAMVCVAVLSNVVALNFFYDVPVKLYSSNLLWMALFLLLPDLRRLANFLALNRPAAAAEWNAPVFSTRWTRIASRVLPILLIGYNLFGQIKGGWQMYRQTYIQPQRPPLYGLYDVETVTRKGKEQPPLLSDLTRWRRIAFEFPGTVAIQFMNDGIAYQRAVYNAAKSTLELSGSHDRATFTYRRVDLDHLMLDGSDNLGPVTIRLSRIDPSHFLLRNRGFHWINEYPFNR